MLNQYLIAQVTYKARWSQCECDVTRQHNFPDLVYLEGIANVDDKRATRRFDGDPLAIPANLESAHQVLMQHGEQMRVRV